MCVCVSDDENAKTDEQKQQEWIKADCPEPIRNAMTAGRQRQVARERRNTTGPKGVKADHDEYMAAVAKQRGLDEMHREAIIHRMATGCTLTDGVGSVSLKEQLRQQQQANTHGETIRALQNESDGDESDDDDDFLLLDGDDDFMAAFRKERLMQLMASSQAPVFGEVKEVNGFEFVEEVDKADPRVLVIVHLYDTRMRECNVVNRHLETIARSKSDTLFLRLQATANVLGTTGFEYKALPTFMVYRAGEFVTALVQITEELGESITLDNIDWLLETKVFNPEKTGQQAEGGDVGPVLKANPQMAYAAACAEHFMENPIEQEEAAEEVHWSER